MKSSVFQYPYSKVFRRAESILSRMGLKIVSSDSLKGSIQAKSGFSLSKPGLKVDLIVEEMENHNTKVTISGITMKNLFFQKKRDAERSEADILEALSTTM
ncbi:MAG: hypothetical protein NT126_10585 [Bacteroidetes bacterium]|nr:hypothetical protein [Bacteroidota bacterium]